MITLFNFFDYLKNPIAEYVVGFYKNKTILTLEDCLPDILKLKNSKMAYEKNKLSFIGDELRLFYASISEDFIYCDIDSLVDIDSLKMDCSCENGNEGSYFRANKETSWVKYYLDVYTPTWDTITPETNGDWSCLAYGNGKFIAVVNNFGVYIGKSFPWTIARCVVNEGDNRTMQS